MSSKKDILATIEAYLKDRKGADFQVSWSWIFARIYRQTPLN